MLLLLLLFLCVFFLSLSLFEDFVAREVLSIFSARSGCDCEETVIVTGVKSKRQQGMPSSIDIREEAIGLAGCVAGPASFWGGERFAAGSA